MRQMGSVYQRGDVYWIKYGHQPGQPRKQIRESTGSHIKADAHRLLKLRETKWLRDQPLWRATQESPLSWKIQKGDHTLCLKSTKRLSKSSVAAILRALNG